MPHQIAKPRWFSVLNSLPWTKRWTKELKISLLRCLLASYCWWLNKTWAFKRTNVYLWDCRFAPERIPWAYSHCPSSFCYQHGAFYERKFWEMFVRPSRSLIRPICDDNVLNTVFLPFLKLRFTTSTGKVTLLFITVFEKMRFNVTQTF